MYRASHTSTVWVMPAKRVTPPAKTLPAFCPQTCVHLSLKGGTNESHTSDPSCNLSASFEHMNSSNRHVFWPKRDRFSLDFVFTWQLSTPQNQKCLIQTDRASRTARTFLSQSKIAVAFQNQSRKVPNKTLSEQKTALNRCMLLTLHILALAQFGNWVILVVFDEITSENSI